FLTTVPDAVIEERLFRFCHLLGMDRSEFARFLNRRYVATFWLGLAKYNFSKGHMASSYDDYSPEAQRTLANTTIFSAWNIAIPTSEQRRLATAYGETPAGALPRLDVIVLIK